MKEDSGDVNIMTQEAGTLNPVNLNQNPNSSM